MKTGIIYAYRNKINGKFYIGQTTSPEKRHKEHMRMACTHCYAFVSAIKKYGKESFEYEVLMKDIPYIELNEWERYFIWLYRSYGKGYNLTPGGDFDIDVHNEPWFKERKIAGIKKAWARPGYKENMLAKLRIAFSNPETKLKKKKAQTSTMAIPEVKERHRKSATIAQRKPYQRLIRSNPVVCIETGEWFISYQEARTQKGVDPGSLTRVLQGKLSKTGGYHWRHATPEEIRINMEVKYEQILEN